MLRKLIRSPLVFFRKVIGVLSSNVAFPVLVGLAITFGLFGLVGRFLDQSVEDINEEA